MSRPTRFRFLFALAALLPALSLLAAGPAHASIGPPVKMTLVNEPTAARPGEPYRGVLRVFAGENVRLDSFVFEGRGWNARFASMPGTLDLAAGESVDLPFVATPTDPSSPLAVTAQLDGRTVGKRLVLGGTAFDRQVKARPTVEDPIGRTIPFPGVTRGLDARPVDPSGPAAKDLTPSLATVHDETHDIADPRQQSAPDGGPVAKRRSITIEGRFVYQRDDGGTYGVDNATVRVYDEDTGPDNKVAQGITDINGYYSLTFDWDPCLLCDTRPDVYVEFELSNSEVTVESATFEVNYRYASGTLGDFEGSYYDFGWLGPADESEQAGPHVFNHVLRTWRWVVNNTSQDPPSVDVQWPDGDTGAFYRPFWEEIHVSSGREWNEATMAHEYGHHFINIYAQSQTPDYCNGICDDETSWYEFWDDGCGHCIWCEETDHDAWNEGWPNWLADVVTRDHIRYYGYDVMNRRDMESLRDCFVDDQYDDARITEGFLAALLRDIEDGGTGDDEPDFEGRDAMAWGIDEIMTVTVQDDPLTPVDFLANFLSRYGTTAARREAIWFTAANNGYQTDNANPDPPTNLSSTSHQVGVDSPDNTIRFNWTTAVDDQSGVQGYGIFVSSDAASPPSNVMDIGDLTTYTTEPLNPGTYYFNIRTLDNAGNWSSGYVSAGPYIVREPLPANLTLDMNPTWVAEVTPRELNDSAPTYVPAPGVLPGNSQGTYWNTQSTNTGETSVPCCPYVNVRVDGYNLLSLPFDPVDVSDVIAGLGPGTIDNSLNQGPVTVRGGRHTFGAVVDSRDEVAETDETDNMSARQWIWTPLELTPSVAIERTMPPDRDGGWGEATGSLWYNTDGLRFQSSGWWNAVWVHADAVDEDVDARLHEASTGAQDGFDTNVGWSARGPGQLDAVFVNRNVTIGTEDWDVGVMQASNAYEGGYYSAEHVTSNSFSFGDSTDVAFGDGEMMQLWEVFVPSTATGPVSVTVQLAADLGPYYPALQASWFDQTFGTGDLNDATSADVTALGSGWLRLDLDVQESGYYCLVLHRDPDGDTGPWNMTVEVDRSPPDWLPLKPPNWYAPVVPHLADADLTNLSAPPNLVGNQPETYVSLTVTNQGGTGTDDFFRAFTRIDGVDVTGSVWSSWPAQFTRTVQARGPLTIDGGRHTLTLVCDPLDEYEELSETNNVFGEQWIWTPLQLDYATPVTRDQPEGRTVGWSEISTGEPRWFNADGLHTPFFQPSGDDGYWGAVTAMPAADSDVDIRWHPRSTGPKDGFASNLGLSSWGPGQSDLILANFNETGFADFDVGVLDGSGEGGYTAEVLQSTFLGTPAAVPPGPYSIGSGHIARLFELDLPVGIHVIRLENLEGGADLGVSLHGPGVAHPTKSQALEASWFSPAGENEWITVEVTEAGFHALAVWKVGAADLPLDASFSLHVSDQLTDAPPTTGTITRSAIHQVRPNPFNPRTVVAFDLRSQGTVSVEVLNLRGERVATLVDAASLGSGRHEVVWNGEDDAGRQVASGTYFVRLRTPDGDDQRKVTLLK